jgi:hypothetical protein
LETISTWFVQERSKKRTKTCTIFIKNGKRLKRNIKNFYSKVEAGSEKVENTQIDDWKIELHLK